MKYRNDIGGNWHFLDLYHQHDQERNYCNASQSNIPYQLANYISSRAPD